MSWAVARCRSDAFVFLWGFTCGEKVARQMADALKKNVLFGRIMLGECVFACSSWAILCEVLTKSVTLASVECLGCEGLNLALLSGCKALEEVRASGAASDSVAALLESVPTLKTLHLTRVEGVEVLAPLLFRSDVASLTLHACSFSSYRDFGHVLARMEFVELNCIDLGGAREMFVDALRSGRVRVLHLIGNNISLASCTEISTALSHNSTLKTMSLSLNPEIGSAGVGAIANALKENTTLTRLNLVGNRIQGEGLEVLAKMLRVNKSLTDLNLEDNVLTCKDLCVLADVLGVNTSLRSLSLGEVGQRSDPFLERLLQSNGAITQLKVGGMFCQEFNERNQRMHKRAKDAALAFILCWKRREGVLLLLSKDLIVPIAEMVWATRTDFVWQG